MDVQGKRLLHLGGAQFQMPAIERARELGCFVVTADNRPENPGHRLADVYANVSTVDREAVLAVARRHEIDGVMTFGSDVAAPTVCYVAQEMGLPGNPLAAAEVLQRKDLFRAFQKTTGLPHPDFAVASTSDQAKSAYRKVQGRVIVKPADSSGSKGMSVIQSEADAAAAFEQARAFSRCGHVVLERFLPPDTLELDGDVLVKDGQLAFRHYGHNYFPKRTGALVPCGEIFPGFFDETVAAQMDRQMQRVIATLQIRNGCMNFDGILSGGSVHFLEIGLRNGGNYVPHMIQMSTGVDLTRAAVLLALGADVPCERFSVPDAVPVASYILNADVEGRFEGFDLSTEIESRVTGSRLFCEIGSRVLPFTQGDRALGIVFFRFPDLETLRASMADIERHVTVRVRPAGRQGADA
jgi:biotin carboxylase